MCSPLTLSLTIAAAVGAAGASGSASPPAEASGPLDRTGEASSENRARQAPAPAPQPAGPLDPNGVRADGARPSEVRPRPESEWWAPFGGSVTLDASVGIGTFVAHGKADDPYYASTLGLAPTWSFDDHLALSLTGRLTYEWTHLVTPCHPASGPRANGAPREDCADTNDPNGRRTSLDDVELALAHDALYVLEPLTLSGWSSIALPTSRDSRHTNNLFTLGAGGRAGLDLSPASVGLSIGGRKFFPTAEAAVLDAIAAQASERGGTPIGRCASFRRDACILLSGFAPTWRVSAELDASIELPWIDGLSGNMSLGYAYSRRYGRDPDAFSSRRTDAGGEVIVDGVSADDTTFGSIEVAYKLDDRWAFAFGASSQQPARTSDGRAIRFPFYDFISPAQNYTAWYLSGTFSLP